MSLEKHMVESFAESFAELQDPSTGKLAQLNADLSAIYWKAWKKALKRYLKNPRDPFRAAQFLEHHPANQRLKWGCPEGWFYQNIDWCYVQVDPRTKRVKKDPRRNTETNVWIEWGPWHEAPTSGPEVTHYPQNGIASHDPRVNTAGKTMEEAMVNLAHNIWELYRDKSDVPNDARLTKKQRW